MNPPPQGIAINKDDAELTEAVQKAMQYLMDNGYLTDILAHYGADSAALTTAELNPSAGRRRDTQRIICIVMHIGA